MKPKLYDKYKYAMTKFGDIYCAFEPPACKAKQIRDVESIIRAGQVFCRGYDAYLDGHFIPGEYTHSGICINEIQIIHFVAEGACSIDPIDFIKDCDRFIILQPKWPSEDALWAAINRAIWHCEANESEYDFTFQEDGKFYCHEGTSDCLGQGGVSISKTKKSFGVWPFKFERELYLAENIIEVCPTIYEFDPEYKGY